MLPEEHPYTEQNLFHQEEFVKCVTSPSDVIEGISTIPYYYRSLYIYKKMNGCMYGYVC